MAKLDKTAQKRLDKSIGAALFSDTERMEMWFTENWKRVASGAVALVVILGIAVGVVRYVREQEAAGARALRNAAEIAELEKALEKYDGNVGAPLARYRLGHKLFSGKNYPEAVAVFEKVVSDRKSDPMLVEEAKLQLAYTKEVSGDPKGAAELFAALGNDLSGDPEVRAEADYGAARLYLDLGDVSAACKILDKGRLSGNSRALAVWNAQLDALQLAVKNGDFKSGK